jgi:hypothetical protein
MPFQPFDNNNNWASLGGIVGKGLGRGVGEHLQGGLDLLTQKKMMDLQQQHMNAQAHYQQQQLAAQLTPIIGEEATKIALTMDPKRRSEFISALYAKQNEVTPQEPQLMQPTEQVHNIPNRPSFTDLLGANSARMFQQTPDFRMPQGVMPSQRYEMAQPLPQANSTRESANIEAPLDTPQVAAPASAQPLNEKQRIAQSLTKAKVKEVDPIKRAIDEEKLKKIIRENQPGQSPKDIAANTAQQVKHQDYIKDINKDSREVAEVVTLAKELKTIREKIGDNFPNTLTRTLPKKAVNVLSGMDPDIGEYQGKLDTLVNKLTEGLKGRTTNMRIQLLKDAKPSFDEPIETQMRKLDDLIARGEKIQTIANYSAELADKETGNYPKDLDPQVTRFANNIWSKSKDYMIENYPLAYPEEYTEGTTYKTHSGAIRTLTNKRWE